MDERQWLSSDDPAKMLEFVRGRVSDRKLRLFGLALYIQWVVKNPESTVAKQLDNLAERDYAWIDSPLDAFPRHWNLYLQDAPAFAEGAIQSYTTVGIRPTQMLTSAGVKASRKRVPASYACDILRDIVGNPFREVTLTKNDENNPSYREFTHPASAGIPFSVFRRKWLTPLVVTMAQTIYDERTFDHTPILADTLSDVGCENEDILRHLRGWERCSECGGTGSATDDSGGNIGVVKGCDCRIGWRQRETPCVRGCWAIDLILGKE